MIKNKEIYIILYFYLKTKNNTSDAAQVAFFICTKNLILHFDKIIVIA